MKRMIAGMAIALWSLAGAIGQTVDANYAAGDSQGWTNLLGAGGTALADNNVLLYGTFGALTEGDLNNLLSGGLTPTELASINDDFSVLFQWQVGDGSGDVAGSFNVNFSTNTTAFNDERMYLLAYNVTSFDENDQDLATEFGLIRNDLDGGTDGRFPIVGPGFPVSSFLYLDSGFGTGIAGSFVDNGYQMISVIPEPGTWAMLAVGLGLVALRVRRKR